MQIVDTLDEVLELDFERDHTISFNLTEDLRFILYKDQQKTKQGEILVFSYDSEKIPAIAQTGTNYTKGARVRDRVATLLKEEFDEEIERMKQYFKGVSQSEEIFKQVLEITNPMIQEIDDSVNHIRRSWANDIFTEITDYFSKEITLDDFINEVNKGSNEIVNKEPEVKESMRRYRKTGKVGNANILARAFEILTLGKSSEYMVESVKEYTYQMLGWELLSDLSEGYSQILEEERDLLRQYGDDDLANNYDLLSNTYRRLSTQAGYAANRMKSLVEDYGEIVRILNMTDENFDVTGVKEKIKQSVENSLFGKERRQ